MIERLFFNRPSHGVEHMLLSIGSKMDWNDRAETMLSKRRLHCATALV